MRKGKAYANRKPESERPVGDMYETPSAMVIELLESGLFFPTGLNMKIFDPCCGHKKIGNVLREYGYTNIIEKDIIYGDDFLAKDKEGNYVDLSKYDIIIMNPPFKLFDEFVKKAKLQAKYVYCIGKPNFFGAHQRNINGLWNNLKWCLIFDRMIAFDKPEINGKVECGMIVSNWFIWDWEYERNPMIKIIDVQKYIKSSTRSK